MIYWSSHIVGKFPETEQDSLYDNRIYSVWTKDFNTFSEVKLLYDPGFSVIDAHIVKEGNQYLMFAKNETDFPVPAKYLFMATSEFADGPYSAPSKPITNGLVAEGPSAIKLGNRWMVYFDLYDEGRFGAVSSNDLIQWTDESNNLHFDMKMRHGTVFHY